MARQTNGRHPWLFALAALAFIAIAAPASAQGIVKGVVTAAKGQPVEGAKVGIESTESNRKFETTTNKKGEYTQSGLQSGAYKLTIEKDKMATGGQVRVRQGAPATANFTLAPGMAPGMSPEAAAKNQEILKVFQE